MCGIYGSTIKYNEQQVKAKLKRTAFRGPDKMGLQYYANGENHLIFGHNRLSIIDLDPRSDQPFNYLDLVHIVFNGEIYNFQSIKTELQSKGHQFKTKSDTEVICAAYLEYGKACLDKLHGMFAFVIFDVRKNELFGARDRLGKKPFYYCLKDQNLEFASQISSIQQYRSDLTISSKAISYYYSWGNVPDPYSIFNEIKKLKAGHYFTFNLSSKIFKEDAYWDIDYEKKNNYKGTYEDAKIELDTLLRETVTGRLFADVPVGVFLSGGVDSSVVAAIATKCTSSKIKTFSVKFNEKGFDESAYAQQVADHLNTDHNVIECNYNEGLELIDNFCHYYDEPFADSSAIPSMLLAKHTRKHVTVALSGDGGDESFIGYTRYNWALKGGKYYDVPYPIRKLGGKFLELIPHYRLNIIAKAVQRKTTNHAYLSSMTGLNHSYAKTDYDNNDVEELKYLFHKNSNFLERMSDFDLKTYLNWDINTKVDRATMAFSLEARAPLLDHQIVEFANKLPTEFKMKDGNQKRILKDVLYKYVPEAIFDRPKAGFTMPFADWFKHDLKDYVLSELDLTNLKNIPGIHPEKVHKLIAKHMNGSANSYPLIWKLIVLKQWLNNNGSQYPIV